MSSLDALISHTSPELTPHQRLDLRKSLVDELFEELIQRHHKRVIEELRLDVEEFIAPPPNLESPGDSPGTPKSTQSTKLNRCESMDFKQPESAKVPVSEKTQVKIGSKLWQSARKCSEVIQKKMLKKSDSGSKQTAEPSVQVTRKGHRPLSAIVTSNSSRKQPQNVIEDDSDNEQEAAARRLLRSQIIKSFWEQHDNEASENEDYSQR